MEQHTPVGIVCKITAASRYNSDLSIFLEPIAISRHFLKVSFQLYQLRPHAQDLNNYTRERANPGREVGAKEAYLIVR